MSDKLKLGSGKALGIVASIALAAGAALAGSAAVHAVPPVSGMGVLTNSVLQSAPQSSAKKSMPNLTATSNTKLRAKGSSKAKVLLEISKGAGLKPVQPLKDGWYKVSYKGEVGYVLGKHVKEVKAKPKDTSKQTVKSPARGELGFIVNKEHKLSASYKPVLKTIPGTSKQLAPEAANAYTKMRKAAKADGRSLTAVSAYRSYARQKAVFASWSRTLGVEQASRVSARPGTSEHQTGLALDVGAANGRCVIAKCFANTREGKWLAKNAYKYGFIMRYPKGTEKITGYDFEPWHFRYVGTGIAKDMKARDIKTLERYYTQ